MWRLLWRNVAYRLLELIEDPVTLGNFLRRCERLRS
jgi:hypothetical protein